MTSILLWLTSEKLLEKPVSQCEPLRIKSEQNYFKFEIEKIWPNRKWDIFFGDSVYEHLQITCALFIICHCSATGAHILSLNSNWKLCVFSFAYTKSYWSYVDHFHCLFRLTGKNSLWRSDAYAVFILFVQNIKHIAFFVNWQTCYYYYDCFCFECTLHIRNANTSKRLC